jgi:hypothetical protein
LIATIRSVRNVDVTALALAVSAAADVHEDPEHSSQLLAEIEPFPGIRGSSYYTRQLPGMVRTSLAAANVDLAKELLSGIDPRYPLEENALCAGRAHLAEYDRNYTKAARRYAEAADRWHQFGNVPERAYALLGRGRCLVASGETSPEQPLQEARGLFASMGYAPALAETDRLLEAVASPAS